jgi:hypothetical protein
MFLLHHKVTTLEEFGTTCMYVSSLGAWHVIMSLAYCRCMKYVGDDCMMNAYIYDNCDCGVIEYVEVNCLC